MALPPFLVPLRVLYVNGFEPEDGAFFGVNGQWNEWDFGQRSSTRSYDSVVKPYTGVGIFETSPYNDTTQGASYTGFVFRDLEDSLAAHAWSGPRPQTVTAHFMVNTKGAIASGAHLWSVRDGFPTLNATSSFGTRVQTALKLNIDGSISALLGDPGSETVLDESAPVFVFGANAVGGEAYNGIIVRVKVDALFGEIEVWWKEPGAAFDGWVRILYLTNVQTQATDHAYAYGFTLGSYVPLLAGAFGETLIQYDDLLVTDGAMLANVRAEWFTTAGDGSYSQFPQVYDGWGDFGGYQDHVNTTTHWKAVRDNPQLESGQDEDFSEVSRGEVGGGDRDSFVGTLAQDYGYFDMFYWGEDYYTAVNPNFPRPARATGDILALVQQACMAQGQAAAGTYLATARLFLTIGGVNYDAPELFRLRPRDPAEEYAYIHGSAPPVRPAGRGASLGYLHFWKTWPCNPATGLPWTEAQADAVEFGCQAVSLGVVLTQISYWLIYGTMPVGTTIGGFARVMKNLAFRDVCTVYGMKHEGWKPIAGLLANPALVKQVRKNLAFRNLVPPPSCGMDWCGGGDLPFVPTTFAVQSDGVAVQGDGADVVATVLTE